MVTTERGFVLAHTLVSLVRVVSGLFNVLAEWVVLASRHYATW